MIGAAAMALHGAARQTADIDFLTVDTSVLDQDFWAAVAVSAKVSVTRGDMFDPLRGVVRIVPEDGRSVDVVVGKWKWEAAAISRAERMPRGERAVPVVTLPDLVLLKLSAGGPKDAWDVEHLLGLATAATVATIEERLVELQAEAHELWRKVRRADAPT
jgi:hypothetical protein